MYCTSINFCGWLRIPRQVIQAFGQCKDIEYSCLLHLFEELVPPCFLHYPVIIVRGGQFEQLASSMKPLAIMFVEMDSDHYNKASLSLISDEQHQKENFPDDHAAKSTTCSALNEKKVEIFHSTSRSRIRKTDKGYKIQETARLIARSKFEEDGFKKTYLPQYLRG